MGGVISEPTSRHGEAPGTETSYPTSFSSDESTSDRTTLAMAEDVIRTLGAANAEAAPDRTG